MRRRVVESSSHSGQSRDLLYWLSRGGLLTDFLNSKIDFGKPWNFLKCYKFAIEHVKKCLGVFICIHRREAFIVFL